MECVHNESNRNKYPLLVYIRNSLRLCWSMKHGKILLQILMHRNLSSKHLLLFLHPRKNKKCVFCFWTVRSNLLSQRGCTAKSLDHIAPNPRGAFKIWTSYNFAFTLFANYVNKSMRTHENGDIMLIR